MATKREIFLFDLCTRKETENRQLQSTIAAQEDIIKRLKKDAEFWYGEYRFPTNMPVPQSGHDQHTQLMNELGEKGIEVVG